MIWGGWCESYNEFYKTRSLYSLTWESVVKEIILWQNYTYFNNNTPQWLKLLN